jgi:hypothetical protein
MERSAPICYIDSSEEPNSRLIIINRRLAGYSTRKSVLYSYYSGSNKNYSLWEKKTPLWRLPNITFRVAVKSKGKGTFKIHERGKIKEEETLGHFSILSPSKSDGSLAQLEWERDVWLDVNRGLPHILSSTGQSHTPRRNKKRESEMHIISIWNRSAGKGTFTTPSFSFFHPAWHILLYIERERTNKRAAAVHHGKCQTLMLSARGGETEIKDELLV